MDCQPNRPVFIATEDMLGRCVDCCRAAPHVALDTEADSLHHYRAKVCLIQLSFGGHHCIIDTLADINVMTLLDVLAKTKLIIHGADFDLRMLRDSFGFRPENEVFDTMLAAQLLGFDQVGLASLVKRFFNVTLSKKGQKSDWSRRPLTDAQLDYAGGDTLYLERIADILSRELERRGRLAWHREACAWMVRATAQDTPRDPDEIWRIKGAGALRDRELMLLKELWHWREHEAKHMDLPPFRIMSNQTLLDLASRLAANPQYESPVIQRLSSRRRAAITEAIRIALATPRDKWPGKLKLRGKRLPAPPHASAFRQKVIELAGTIGIDPAVIASRATIDAVARARAITVEAIMLAGPTMRWQAELLKPIAEAMYRR